ncbi:MAG: acyltransferase family protein [Lachnospiraceae bacterium]|nr:acyltransferase family protein [Lachnospiraceae bacterium]
MADYSTGTVICSILDKIVCYLFIMLLFWGATNKFGKKDEFNDDFTSLEVMKSLRGLAAIGVMLHHISQEQFLQQEGVLSGFVNAGVYFVAIFFFCSGYGLIKSLDSKKDYLKGFIRKRIVRAIVVPFYVNVLIYGLLMFIVRMPINKTQWITNLLGLTMMNRYAWFPIVLALLYLVFFLCFRFIKKRPVCFVVIFVFMIAMGLLFCFEGHYAWWYGPKNWWMDEQYWENGIFWWQNEQVLWFNGEWWVNSAPAFLTGLIFANYEKQITAFFKKSYALKFNILLAITGVLFILSEVGQAVFGYWTEWEGKGPEIGDKIATYFMQIPLLTVFAFTVVIFMMKFHVKNPVLSFFGKYSLHTYLMNLAAITVMRFVEVPVFFDFGKGNYLIYGIAVLAISTYAGVKEQQLTEFVQRLLFRDRPKIAVAYNTRFGLLDEGDVSAEPAVAKTEAAKAKPANADPAKESSSVKAVSAPDKAPAGKAPEKAEKNPEKPSSKEVKAAPAPAKSTNTEKSQGKAPAKEQSSAKPVPVQKKASPKTQPAPKKSGSKKKKKSGKK